MPQDIARSVVIGSSKRSGAGDLIMPGNSAWILIHPLKSGPSNPNFAITIYRDDGLESERPEDTSQISNLFEVV
jgi:hypothetical protein